MHCAHHGNFLRYGQGRLKYSSGRSSELLCMQGSAGAAELAERLAPVHNDKPEEQLSQIPVLALLSESERQGLANSYKLNKDKSFLQWCMSNGVVMEPSPDNVTPAMQNLGLIAG